MGLDEFVTPEGFARDFFEMADAVPLPFDPQEKGTRWFEGRMQAVAKKHGLHCQNLTNGGEWMTVDHVFVEGNNYVNFPLVAVEHENGDISKSAKRGELPVAGKDAANIEWACWKALAMRSHLSVLVAYPWAKDKEKTLKVLASIVDC